MTLPGQRTLIRKHFGRLYVGGPARSIRGFTRYLDYNGLPAPWMKSRLCGMADILNGRNMSMADYVAELQRLEHSALPDQPSPALNKIRADLRAGEAKTLSVFVRDCVKGNCFPIDSRVRRLLQAYEIPEDEEKLVSMSLALGKDPRRVARMFYESGSQEAIDCTLIGGI